MKGALLDVGCGAGKYLAVARGDGWDGVGIEVSPQAAAIAQSLGFDVLVGDALSVPFPARHFDRVRCAHVLEHVTDPVKLLGRLRDAVTPTGAIEILVPNRNSLLSRISGQYWHGLELPRHLYHFRPTDIERLAARAGLRLENRHYSSSPSTLLWTVDKLLAAHRAGTARRLRDMRALRRTVFPLTFLLARARLSDVVEYRFVRSDGEPGSTSDVLSLKHG